MLLILITLLGAMPSQRTLIERRPLPEYLLALTGHKFTDCGGYAIGLLEGWEQKQKAVLDCAMKALREDTPFFFSVGYFGPDSSGVEGLVRTSKGDLLRYTYDTTPCGIGRSSCYKESFVTFPCPNPNLDMQGQVLKFRCEKQ